MSEDKIYLNNLILGMNNFLANKLKLKMHPDKVFIKTLYSGVDFLGWVIFFDHRILRSKTKKRMLKRIKKNQSIETLNSYLGLLKHGNSRKILNNIISLNNWQNRV